MVQEYRERPALSCVGTPSRRMVLGFMKRVSSGRNPRR